MLFIGGAGDADLDEGRTQVARQLDCCSRDEPYDARILHTRGKKCGDFFADRLGDAIRTLGIELRHDGLFRRR